MTETTIPTTPPTDLESYLRVHRLLRMSATTLAEALRDRPPTSSRSGRALDRWIRGFTGEVRCHHHIEDELLFPALAARVATWQDELGPGLANDHGDLDEVLDELDRAAEARDWSTAGLLAAQLRDHLVPHLDLEDREVAGLFARHFSSAEFEELNVAAIKMVAPKQLLFTVPWTMSLLHAGEQQAVLASAPGVMRWLWMASRGKYRRQATRALGGPR